MASYNRFRVKCHTIHWTVAIEQHKRNHELMRAYIELKQTVGHISTFPK